MIGFLCNIVIIGYIMNFAAMAFVTILGMAQNKFNPYMMLLMFIRSLIPFAMFIALMIAFDRNNRE